MTHDSLDGDLFLFKCVKSFSLYYNGIMKKQQNQRKITINRLMNRLEKAGMHYAMRQFFFKMGMICGPAYIYKTVIRYELTQGERL